MKLNISYLNVYDLSLQPYTDRDAVILYHNHLLGCGNGNYVNVPFSFLMLICLTNGRGYLLGIICIMNIPIGTDLYGYGISVFVYV